MRCLRLLLRAEAVVVVVVAAVLHRAQHPAALRRLRPTRPPRAAAVNEDSNRVRSQFFSNTT